MRCRHRDPCAPAPRTGAATATPVNPSTLFFTVDEVAALLRTKRKGIYARIERGQLPGVTRLGRRLLIRQDELLDWLDRCRTPSPKE